MSGGGIQDGAYGYDQNVAPTASFVGQGGQPVWMKGLMGALTGDKTYGKNAPMIHQALAGFMKPQQQQPQMMPQMMHPMMGAPQAPQMGAPQMPMGQPFAAPQQIPSMAPWMMGRM